MNTESANHSRGSNSVNNLPPIEKVRRWYRKLPDKKRYLEFITAFLTIPVLLTVLLSNVSNLQHQKNAVPTPTIAPTPTPIVITPLPTARVTPIDPTPTNTPSAQCTPGIGPIEIVYPEENSTVSDDPVCLDIPRQGGNYCSVVWSYRINGGNWSNYTDREVCMYGLSPGTKQLDLRVKSIVSGEEKILRRTFTVAGSVATPTPATQSGTISGI
jgi:hypothetical protein